MTPFAQFYVDPSAIQEWLEKGGLLLVTVYDQKHYKVTPVRGKPKEPQAVAIAKRK